MVGRSPMRLRRRYFRLPAILLGSASVIVLATQGLPASANGGGAVNNSPTALSISDVPTPPGIERFIRDNTAAQKLGKALFWDMQAGSDGRQACASCHFSAGADARSRNQLNPRGGGFGIKGPNAELTAADFPIHTGDVVGSAGVLPSAFKGIAEGDAADLQSFATTDPNFHVGSVNVRRSTGRNAPSAVNAVFNFRNFWDGRAQNDFNGVNPFGNRDAGATVGQVNGSGGVDQVSISIANSSLASQADGPPGNPVEMSSDGRSLSDIGKKLLALRPLGSQQVSGSDSLLGDLAHGSGRGLNTSYRDMIQQAFQSSWWDSSARVGGPAGQSYSLMQYNFPLFWGLAIQAYEATLVSDDSPFDQAQRGNASAMSALAQAGMGVFDGKGKCSTCHSGALFTNATVQSVAANGAVDANGHDTGFVNIGVSATAADPGQAGTDPFGQPLSIAGLTGQATNGVAGSFKVPTLRNVELTAPYFHNGGKGTLRQVVDFYSQGGDFANPEKSADIQNLGLSDGDKDALVAFLDSLTDQRVRNQSAPFDHPQLFVANGEQTRADGSVITDANGNAVDCFKAIAATGASGGAPIAQFPGFSGTTCDDPPPLAKPASGNSGSGGGSSGSITTSKPAAVRPAPAVLRLSIKRRLSLRDVHRNGLRLRATVPQNARRVRVKVYRLVGKRRVLVGTYVKRITRGGRIKVTYRSKVTKRLKAGTYLIEVDAGLRTGAYLPGGSAVQVRMLIPR